MRAHEVLLAGLAVLLGLALIDLIPGVKRGGRSTAARLLLAVFTGYRRYLSPALPPSCRFTPSCSAYAVEAVQRHGALRGGWLTARRLVRCAPWHRGGHDPVPTVVGRFGAPRRTHPPADRVTTPSPGAPRC
jgi:putative membrane protein insertion efficiency factor